MTRARASLLALSLALAFGACTPLDVLGYGEDVIDQSHAQAIEDPLADDRIEDKHPVRDESITIEERFGACTAVINKSGSVTKLDVVPFAAGDTALSGALFPGYVEAAQALGDRPILPSMEVVDAALKPFTDGLYAAIELGAEDGSSGSLVNKRALFTDLLAELGTRAASGTPAEQPLAREAGATIAAALSLGDPTSVVPAAFQADVSTLLTTFEADVAKSTPGGFYSWSPELQAIFRQDRLLQSPPSVEPSFGAFASMAVALQGKPALVPRYQAALDLYAGLTNSYFHLPVTDLYSLAPDASALANVEAIKASFLTMHPEANQIAACAAHLGVLPASDSPETRLYRNLFCANGVPAGNLLDVLIAKIRSGELDLTPTATSGFYDRQVWALETLLVPDSAVEKDHLFLTKRYKQKLVETFKTLITERRETHLKQLDVGDTEVSAVLVAPIDLDVYPVLPVEPFPTFYLRTARAYAFLESFLPAAIGASFLDTTGRLLEDGTRSATPLSKELHETTCRVYGLHVVASRSLGMAHGMSAEEAKLYAPETCEASARSWLSGWQTDADLARDPRVIVPIQTDSDLHQTIYSAVIGTKIVRVGASFYPGFEPTVAPQPPCVFRSFVDTQPYLVMGQQVEVRIRESTPPPTRAQLRKICDDKKTQADIVAALEAL